MTTGQKIKVARSLRGITQKELGRRVGLQDVRIRQYEIDARTPKEDILIAMADALDVSPLFLKDHSIEGIGDIIHILFELEQTFGATVVQLANTESKYAVTFSNEQLNEAIGVWCQQKELDAEDSYQIWKAKFQREE